MGADAERVAWRAAGDLVRGGECSTEISRRDVVGLFI